MKPAESFALLEYLQQYPVDKTYDQIIMMMKNHPCDANTIITLREYDDFELPKLAQMIDNTRRHYHDDFVWRIDDMLARSR